MKHLSTLALTFALAIGLVSVHARPTQPVSPAATPTTAAFELREVRTDLHSLGVPTLTGSAALCAKLAAMCDSGNQNACLQYDRICEFGN